MAWEGVLTAVAEVVELDAKTHVLERRWLKGTAGPYLKHGHKSKAGQDEGVTAPESYGTGPCDAGERNRPCR